jgi:hypothetical protein
MLPNGATSGVPHEVYPLELQDVHESQQIVGHLAGIRDQGARARAADPAMVMKDDSKLA